MKSEKTLVDNICNGDRKAMRALYEKYSGYAMATAIRYVADRDDAADIVQDAFIRIFSHIESFEWRGEGSLKSWIARVVANEALTMLRKRGNISFTDVIPDEASTEEPDIGAISNDTLRNMIAALPEGYRLVLNLYVFEGMSHKEIAKELGISPSTSASQFFHAKRLLARMINTYLKKNDLNL